MRRRKSDLHARVNRNLPLEFDDVRLTSYAGLELLERYLRTRRFNQLVREAFADLPRWGDFGVVVMVRVFVGLVIVGGRRLRHLAYVADVVIEFVVPEDAMVKQLLRNRDELDFGYTQDCFEAAAAEHFVIAETERLQSGTRTIYYLRPKHAS